MGFILGMRNYIKTVFGYSHYVHTTIVQVGIYCQISHYYTSQSSQLTNTDDDLPPLVTFTFTVKLDIRGEASKSISLLISLFYGYFVSSATGIYHQVLVGNQEY